MSLHGFQGEPVADRAETDPDLGGQSWSSPAPLRGSAAPVTNWFEDQAVVDAHISCLLVKYDGLPTGPVRNTVIDPPADWVFEQPVDSDLHDALADVNGSPAEAKDEGFPIPTTASVDHARRVVRFMHGLLSRRIEAYPTPDAEVAVVAPGGPGRSVMVLLDSQDGALVTVNLSGNHRRARYSQARDLPDAFLREALADLVGS